MSIFSVQMMKILLLDKDTLRSFQKSPVSLMPPYTVSALSDKDLEDHRLFVGCKREMRERCEHESASV